MSEWIEKEEVLKQIDCWFRTGEYKYSNATHYLNKRISSIKSKINWISVNDKLPDDDVLVLVYTKDGVVSVCSFVIANAFANLKNLKVWEDNNGYYVSDVTHWMPLPSIEGLNNDT